MICLNDSFIYELN